MPVLQQTSTSTNTGLLVIRSLEIYFIGIQIKVQKYLFKEIHL